MRRDESGMDLLNTMKIASFNASLKSFLDEHDIHYQALDGGILRVYISGRNIGQVQVITIFKVSSFCEFRFVAALDHCPRITSTVYEACNEINSECHWGKLYIDENGRLLYEVATMLEEEADDEICGVLLLGALKALDDEYFIMKKALWGS